MDPTTRSHLPRLHPEHYRGWQFVHWIMTISKRKTGWLNAEFHEKFKEILFSSASSYDVVVPAFCLMPDHLHILAAGIHSAADQKLWARAIRRKINLILKPHQLQRQAYDHVLRPAETDRDAFDTLVHYICENPVRSGLTSSTRDWPFSAALVPDLPDLTLHGTGFHAYWWDYWNGKHG